MCIIHPIGQIYNTIFDKYFSNLNFGFEISQHFQRGVFLYGASDQVPLNDVAAHFLQDLKLFFGFDPLGNTQKFQFIGNIEHHARDREAVLVGRDIADKLAVDLNGGNGQFFQI